VGKYIIKNGESFKSNIKSLWRTALNVYFVSFFYYLRYKSTGWKFGNWITNLTEKRWMDSGFMMGSWGSAALPAWGGGPKYTHTHENIWDFKLLCWGIFAPITLAPKPQKGSCHWFGHAPCSCHVKHSGRVLVAVWWTDWNLFCCSETSTVGPSHSRRTEKAGDLHVCLMSLACLLRLYYFSAQRSKH